jgi:hypothetical protein
VSKSAADNVIPVTLQLGGKSASAEYRQTGESRSPRQQQGTILVE